MKGWELLYIKFCYMPETSKIFYTYSKGNVSMVTRSMTVKLF